MAQELRIDTWCDVCLADGQHEPGEPVTVSLDGRQPRLLDLCERDRKTYVGPLAELLDNLGRKLETAPKRARAAASSPTAAPPPTEVLEASAGDFPCPLCDHEQGTPKALRDHLARAHGTTTGEVFGLTCAVCGLEKDSPQGLGIHAARGHGLPGMAAAFGWAAANGDPHGVVAERRAAFA